jgi:hypothetical protein
LFAISLDWEQLLETEVVISNFSWDGRQRLVSNIFSLQRISFDNNQILFLYQ